MKNNIKDIMAKKIMIGFLPYGLGLGCLVFGILGFIVIFGGFFRFIVGFELNMDENSDFADMVDDVNKDMKVVADEILTSHPQALLNGPLIASTIMTIREYDSEYASPLDETDYDPETYEDSEPVSRSTIKKIAYGMLATQVTLTCEEDSPPSGSTATTRTYTFIKELAGIGDNASKSCESGFSEKSTTEDLVYSLEYYKIIFLPKYLSEELDLDPVSDKEEIQTIIEQIVEDFDTYQTTVYETSGDLGNLVGIKVINTSPIIVGNQALPVNLGIAPLGVKMPGPNGDFGERIHPIRGTREFHPALDLSCNSMNPPIYSMFDGRVYLTGYGSGPGNYIMVESNVEGKTMMLVYSHLVRFSVNKNDTVTAGQQIGICGSTGTSTGNHLHFEMRLILSNYDLCPGYRDGNKCYLNPTSTLTGIYNASKNSGGPTVEFN